MKGIIRHFGKYAHWLFCQALDEKINITLMSVNMKLLPAAG